MLDSVIAPTVNHIVKDTSGVVPNSPNGAAVANFYSENHFNGEAQSNQNTVSGGGVAIRSWIGDNGTAQASYLPFANNEQIQSANSTPASGATGHSQFGAHFGVVNYDHRYTNNDIAAGMTDWSLHTSFSGQTRWSGCSLLVNHYWPTMAFNTSLNGVTGWLYSSNPGNGGGQDDAKQVNGTLNIASTSSTAFTVSAIMSGTANAIVPNMLVTSTLVPAGTFVATFDGISSGTLSQDPTSTGSDSAAVFGLISYATQCAFGAVGFAGPIGPTLNGVTANAFEFTKYAFQAGSDGGVTPGIWITSAHRAKYLEAFHGEDFSGVGLHLANANNTTSPLGVASVTVTSQGNGQYQNGDQVWLISPLSGARAAILSLVVSAGSIASATVIDPGIYNAALSGNVPVGNVAGASNGQGSGATFSVTTAALPSGAIYAEPTAGGSGFGVAPDSASATDPITVRISPIGTTHRGLIIQDNASGPTVVSPRFILQRSLKEPGGGVVGSVEWSTEDSSGASDTYARAVGTVVSDTVGAFTGGIQLRTALNGTEVNALIISGQAINLPGFANGALVVDGSGNIGIGASAVNGVINLGEVNTQQSHTGDTNETVLASIAITGNVMGVNGTLCVNMLGSCTGSANSKTFKIRFGSTNNTSGTAYLSQSTSNSANVSFAPAPWCIANRNATNSQVGDNNPAAGFGSGSIVTSSIDTTATTYIVVTGQLTNTGETIACERLSVTLIPGI